MKPAVIVHGGAGRAPTEDHARACVDGCREAARKAYELLLGGGSALDAVEIATISLEDDPSFNAGVGSVLTADGEVELDAMIMSGDGLLCGGVAALRGFRNPILVARRILERSPHILLAADGAARFAREQGFSPCPPSELVTERSLARWRSERDSAWTSVPGTVGAVAIDSRGSLAAATSTGGMNGKHPGRIGDTPLPGCGTYASNSTGAASATGHGEMIACIVMAKLACDRILLGDDASEAAECSVKALSSIGGKGGIIVVDGEGRLGYAFNSDYMSHASIDDRGVERWGTGQAISSVD